MNILKSEWYTLFEILKRWEIGFFFHYFFSWIIWFFYKKPIHKHVISVSWFIFTVPFYHPINRMLSEIFIYETLSFLKGCKKVVDIWWFVGESALYLAKYNDHIDVYELDPWHYTYLQNHINQQTNITSFPYGIGNQNQEIYISKTGDFDPSLHTSHTQTHIISHIKSITEINLSQYDGLKIDIEWSEYEILPYIIENNLFNIQKWFIEFHLFWDNTQNQINMFEEFIACLSINSYTYWFIDNYNKKIWKEDFVKDKFISICFEK